MEALILAAGVGNRLGELGDRPKSLLEFDGRSLMARHLDNLAALGVARLTVCLGYRHELLEAELQRHARLPVTTVLNPEYREGSVRSLWTARDALRSGHEVLLMDADVLYAPSLLRTLATSRHPNCFLLDRNLPPGDEPVKICLRDGGIVEFRKKPDPAIAWDLAGESVGFFKWSPAAAAELAAITEDYMTQGRQAEPYEEAIRDLILAGRQVVAYEDITNTPWIEIDFPDDVRRARDEVLPGIAND
jgi:choline kinase